MHTTYRPDPPVTGRTYDGLPLTPGVNVDRIDISAGIAMAHQMGYDTAHNDMVLTYALQRHARGEEDAARRTAMSDEGVGNDLTTWYAILAAAIARAEAAAAHEELAALP